MSAVPPTKPTIGSQLDAVLTAAGHDVTVAETDTKGTLGKAWTWLKSEWHNLGTFISVAYMALKTAGKL